MTSDEKIEFIRTRLEWGKSYRFIQHALKAKFGSGVNNNVIQKIDNKDNEIDNKDNEKDKKDLEIKRLKNLNSQNKIDTLEQAKGYEDEIDRLKHLIIAFESDIDAENNLKDIYTRFLGANFSRKEIFPGLIERLKRYRYGARLDGMNVINDFFMYLEIVFTGEKYGQSK